MARSISRANLMLKVTRRMGESRRRGRRGVRSVVALESRAGEAQQVGHRRTRGQQQPRAEGEGTRGEPDSTTYTASSALSRLFRTELKPAGGRAQLSLDLDSQACRRARARWCRGR